jgi:hypothetical protein
MYADKAARRTRLHLKRSAASSFTADVFERAVRGFEPARRPAIS